MMRATLLVFLLTCATGVFAEEAVDRAYILKYYTKYEYMVPMRDGVKLLTAVYAPKDDSQTYPFLITRTPYSVRPYSADAVAEPRGTLKNYAADRFIFVFQDVRGRNGSEGAFVHMRPHIVRKSASDVDESTDTYDTVEWLLRNVPNNNGKAGLLGLSYPGFYAAAGMIDSHHALKSVSPQAPIADWFAGDDFHQGGAFGLAHAFGFFSQFGQQLAEPTRQQWQPFDYRTPDAYQFFLETGPLARIDEVHFKGTRVFWVEMMSHGTYDAFWKQRDIRPHLNGVHAAVMTVGGWYDAENLFGALEIYRNVEQRNRNVANTLVIGPWSHGAWMMGSGEKLGPINFHSRTSEFFQRQIELPFLNHHLKGGVDPKLPEAYVFETGTAQWRRHDRWPPHHVRSRVLTLGPNGQLAGQPAANGASFDEYVSDPAKPVPHSPAITTRVAADYIVGDQRFAATRPDVLVYQSEVLDEDVTIAGPALARLKVSTTGTDADWVVKLIDVHSPDLPVDKGTEGVMPGYQQLVRGAIIRGKFRAGLEQPEPMAPGEVTDVDVSLPDAYHTFRRGHRIMVQVQSSWFPLFDRNPQRFTDIYRATAGDFKKATHRVYHSSTLELSILPATGASPKESR